MKIHIVVILMLFLILTVSSASFAQDVKLKDVPPDHWAYKAVKTLVEKGYLETYQDGTFQGDKAVDRYTLAYVVAKMLNAVATGRTAGDKEGMGDLRKVSTEFREELVLLSREGKLLDSKIKKMEDGTLAIKEDIGELFQFQAEALKMLEDITKKTNALEVELQKQKEEIENLKAELERQKTEADKKISVTRRQVWLAAILAAIAGILL